MSRVRRETPTSHINANIDWNLASGLQKMVGKGKKYSTFTAGLEDALKSHLDEKAKMPNSELIQAFEKYYTPRNLIEIILSSIKIDMKNDQSDVFTNNKWNMKTHRGPLYNSEAILFAEECVKGVINFTESFCENLENYKKELIKHNNA